MIDGSRFRHVVAAMACALLSSATDALATLAISEPWVRPSPDGRSAEVFLKIRSSDEATIADVDSFAARRVSIRLGDTAATARSMPLPANALVELRPDGPRIVLGR